MKRLNIAAAAAAAVVAGIGVTLWAPWASAPDMVYDTVAGYPMMVYYHNLGPSVRVSGFGGVPAISVNRPLSEEESATYMAEARKRVQAAPDLVRSGERVRFMLEDPDGLAWAATKEERTTYFYLFAVLEYPRASIAGGKWVNELCLVAKTGDRFKRCETHNRTYSDM